RVGEVLLGPSALHVEAALGAGVTSRVAASGDLLGGEVHIPELVADGLLLHGRASLHALRIDPLVRVGQVASAKRDGAAGSRAVQASLSGELTIDALDPTDIRHARASFVPTAFSASLGAERALLRP